jgi:hypothetical protein
LRLDRVADLTADFIAERMTDRIIDLSADDPFLLLITLLTISLMSLSFMLFNTKAISLSAAMGTCSLGLTNQ